MSAYALLAPDEINFRSVKYEESETASWMFWKKRRYVVGVLAFLGFFTSYILRVNLSVAIVAMTANKTMTDPEGNIYYVSSKLPEGNRRWNDREHYYVWCRVLERERDFQ